ncbi:hypothetical protein FYJ53_18985 [Eubacterium sp. BL-380-WT-2B]|uniref:hypothetical protein n=1 Tax=Eubacterium sp. BL-380-WT-2B TaxID=2605785 RepID=UPI0012B2A3A1|nr:hypothetical protein [Eubacterium sp. BL-380-WT-2B]MSS95839.1 hypothetical protein [Eubacterium sp. BL-380-WT-2B]
MDVNYEIAEEVAALELDDENEEKFLTEEQTEELYEMIFSEEHGLFDGVDPALEELLKDFFAEIAREQGHEEIKDQWEKIKAEKNEKVLLELQAAQKKIDALEQRLSERNSEIENLQNEMVKKSQIIAVSQTRNLEDERRKLSEQYNQEIAKIQQQYETEIHEMNSKLKEKENELFKIKEKQINLEKENEIRDAFMYADKTEIEAGIREALVGEKEVSLEAYAKRLNEQSESIKMVAQTIHDLVDRACSSEERIKQEVIKAAQMFFEIKLYPKLKSELIEELNGQKGSIDKNTVTEKLSVQK